MAHLTWSVLWTAFALIAATPNNYGYGDDYGNSVLQPQSPNADVPSGFCSGKDNGAYGEGCSKDYWLCWDGVATSQECSFDLMFNQENGQCDFASSIFACSGERPTTQAPLDSSTMEPVDFDCSGLEDGDYPFVQKCQVEYVSCVAGAPWKRSCPDELSFDPENRICDRLENIVACGGSPPTAADVVQIDYECPSPSGSFALVSALCSPTYYICEDNKPTIAMCSDEMIWDDAHKECRMASDIPDCSFDCNGKADSPYSIGCSQNYWWCWEGKATKLACPEGMMFNSENGQCDFENNIFECTGQRVSPTSTVASDFATPPPVDFDCSSVEDGNHAFKDGATCQPKFVSCVGGVAWELTCPDGLLFDPDQLLCERVERIVACGGSLEETTTQSYEDLYSYKQTTPRPRRKIHKTTVAVPITRRAYHQKQKMTTTLADLPTELPSDNYGDYETTTRRRHHKTTTPAAEPTTRRSYYQTTTLAEEPTTSDDSYGSYETTTLAEPITTTRRSSYGYKRTTTPAAEPTTRRSYYQTTTLADEPTTELRSDYGDYETTTLAEPITTTRRSSYGYKRTTTPAAEPTTRRSYYQTTTLAEPTTTSSYDSYETTTLAEPITTTRRSSYGYKHHKRTTTPAAEPTTRRSYYQTTPAAKPTTKQSYSRPIIRRVSKPVTRRHSYYQTTTPAAEPTTRASYYQKKTTPAAEPTTRRSYYQTTTPAAEPTTRASYYQKKKTTTLADKPITRRSYYQTTTPAAEPITTTRRSSYGYKRTTTPAAEPTTRRSYYQTTRLAEPTTRKPYSRPAIRRLLPKPQPIVRQSYQQTTPAAEPVTRNSYNHKRLTTPADVPIVRRTYKLTAEEPTTRKPQFKQSSYY